MRRFKAARVSWRERRVPRRTRKDCSAQQKGRSSFPLDNAGPVAWITKSRRIASYFLVAFFFGDLVVLVFVVVFFAAGFFAPAMFLRSSIGWAFFWMSAEVSRRPSPKPRLAFGTGVAS